MNDNQDRQPQENSIDKGEISSNYLPSEEPFPMPCSAPAHVKAASPLLLTMIILVGGLAVLATVGGVIAIIYNSLAETKINIFGMSISTGHVGVAFVGLGIIMMILVYRNISENIYKLAALPDDRPRRARVKRKGQTRR